jgi:uncharacterized repeat protein (TIGR01451 family)
MADTLSQYPRPGKLRQRTRRQRSNPLLLELLENRLAPAVLPGSTFEIDGNLIVNTPGNLDWANAPQLATATDRPTGQTDNSFGNGTKENDPVPSVVSGSIPNNKSDLTHFYVGSESGTNSHIYMYLAWERANTLGTANIDFEFNQSATTSSNHVTPVRTAGDMLISFDFANGGNTVNLSLRTWNGSAWGTAMDLSGSGFAIGAVNDPAFGQTTVTDPVSGTTQPQDTFGEAAIDLTAAGVFNINDCVHFGSAYVKSRSSASFTAEMKDFIAPIGVNISNCPDLILTKDPDTAIISAGDPAGFTITVTNTGVPTSTGVTVSDTLPLGVTWSVDAISPGATFSITAGVLNVSFGNIPGGQSRFVHISGPTDAADCGTITNSATVSSTNEDPNDLGNNTDTATITVNCPDVAIVKTADTGTISSGETAAFTITVSNIGAGTAHDVTVSDTLQAGIPWMTSTPGASITNGVLTDVIGTLAPGATAVIHVSGVTDATDCGTIPNTATVSASNEDADDLGNNSSTATITVLCPDIHVAKTVGLTGNSQTGTINAGDTAIFTITVSNAGPGTAFGVTVNDPLPAGATWTTDLAGATITNGVLTGTIGTLTAGSSSTFHVFGATTPTDEALHTDGCKLRNTVTVAATNEDPADTNDNCAAAIILVNPVLTPGDTTFLGAPPVIMPPPPPPAPVNSPFEFADGNLVVDTPGNRDWANANNLNIGIDLPSGQNDDAFGNGTKEDNPVPSVVTGSIPNNKSDLTRFYVSSETRADGHIFMYLAWERANTLGTANIDFEFNQSGTPSANGVTPVRTVGDMLISYDFASSGNALSLGLRRWTGSGWGSSTNLSLAGFANGAVNNGFQVSDPLNNNQVLASQEFGEAGIDLTAAGVFTSATCVHFGSAYVKSRSSASFTAEMKDFIPPITVNITNCPDVHVSKTVGSTGSQTGSINAGQPATFTIVVSNDGAGTAQGVTLTDTLPDGVTWSTDNPSTSISIVNGHQVLTGNFGDMISGATATVHVSGATDINSCGKLRNEVFVAATNEPADDQTDDRGAAVIIVNPSLTQADLDYLNCGAPMLAAAPGNGAGSAVLTDSTLQSLWAQAIDQWRAAGVNAQQLAAMQSQILHITDLPSGELGWTRGNQTWIDRTAQGWGWSVNGSAAAGLMDLLTVATHELGHVLALPPTPTGVMEVYLTPGAQFLPTPAPTVPEAAAPVSQVVMSSPVAAAVAGKPLQVSPSVTLDAGVPSVVAKHEAQAADTRASDTHPGTTTATLFGVSLDGFGSAAQTGPHAEAIVFAPTRTPSIYNGAPVIAVANTPFAAAPIGGAGDGNDEDPDVNVSAAALPAGFPAVTPRLPAAQVREALLTQQLASDACFADGSWSAEPAATGDPAAPAFADDFAPRADASTAVAALAVVAGGLSWRVDDAESEPRRRRFLQ